VFLSSLGGRVFVWASHPPEATHARVLLIKPSLAGCSPQEPVRQMTAFCLRVFLHYGKRDFPRAKPAVVFVNCQLGAIKTGEV